MSERDVFEAALELPTEQRAAYLDSVCGSDAALRQRLAALLGKHDRAGSFLEQPAVPPLATVDEMPISERPGTVIGPYKLLEQIGEGGFGVVFLAEQQEPVRRKVALKVLKPGMDSKQVIARFEAERQALALMDHPNIAKVFDGGATPSRRPFFVMELVKGIAVTEYCDQCCLTTRERLELFLSVCRAVQHAHQKGVIHRDLKPSNVLVAIQDGKPAVKVIDFGIAKAVNQRLSERTLLTGFHQMIGTPLYMSPEQAELSPLDVDTRADIYALGVLLYELLTGTTPFEKERLGKASFDELRRIIREEEPPRPSTRLSTLKDKLTTAAAQRRTQPRQLVRAVRGELDWIVVKCLEKDRNRRYETANSLARDVERYLHDEPVLACPPSVAYRLRKFTRRNKLVITSATLVAVALVAGSAVSLWQAVRARRAQADAREAQDRAEANSRQAREAVDRYYTRVSENVLLNEPALEPLRKQLLEDALRYYQGFAAQSSDDQETLAELAAANLRVANLQWILGSQEDWLGPWERATEAMERLLRNGKDAPASPGLRAGVFQPMMGFLVVPRPEEVVRLLTRTCAAWEELVRREPTVAGFRFDLACAHVIRSACELRAGQYAAGFTSARRASELLIGLLRDRPRDCRYRMSLVISRNTEASNLLALGRDAEVEQVERQMQELARGLAAEFPGATVYQEVRRWVADQVGGGQEVRRQFREAANSYREALSVDEALRQRYPTVARYVMNTLYSHANVAEMVWAQGRKGEAAEACRRGVAAAAAVNLDVPDVVDVQARLLATCPDPRFRDPARASDLAARLVERSPREQRFRLTLAAARYAKGDYQAAAHTLAEAAKLSSPEFWNFDGDIDCNLLQALVHGRLGRRDQARACYEKALTYLRKKRTWQGYYRRLCAEAEEILGLPPHDEKMSK
jgi:serine/threonine protein kinase